MIASILCFHYTRNCPRRQRQRCDYCLTTIVHETEKARFPSVFNGFTRIQKRRTFSLKIAQPLKIQHFISYCLKTPTFLPHSAERSPKLLIRLDFSGVRAIFSLVPWLLFDYHFLTTATQYAPVAQLDSACDSDSQGRRFESCRACQNAVKSNDFTAFLYKLVKFSPLRHGSVGWSLFMDK